MLLEQKFKNAVSYSMKSCWAETWGEKPVLQPKPGPVAAAPAAAIPAWGQSLSLSLSQTLAEPILGS